MKITNRLSLLLSYALCSIAFFTACRPAKKVQRIGDVITTKDTVSKAITQPGIVDSATLIKKYCKPACSAAHRL